MARRPGNAHDWLREALIAHRARLVERFDCPATRARLERYAERVRAGGELHLTSEELFLSIHPLDPTAAERFTKARQQAEAWRLDASDSLTPARSSR